MTQIEQDGEDLVEYDPADLQAELDRARQRVVDIEAEMERRAKGDANLMASQVSAIREFEAEQQQRTREATRPPQEPPAAEAEPESPPPEQRSEGLDWRAAQRVPELTPEVRPTTPPAEEWAEFDAVPTAADLRDAPPPPSPPEPETPPPVPEEPVESRRPEPRRPVTPPRSTPPSGSGGPPGDPLKDVMDSFQDPEDPGVMVSEQARILEARRRMAEEEKHRQAAEAEYLRKTGQGPGVRRPPPHRRGRQEDAPSLDAEEVHDVHGAPAFRLPPQEVSPRGRGHGRPRGRGHPREEGPPVNPRSTAPTNPKFKPPRGQ